MKELLVGLITGLIIYAFVRGIWLKDYEFEFSEIGIFCECIGTGTFLGAVLLLNRILNI